MIERSTTLAKFRDFAASFEQQDRFCVQESKDKQDSNSTIFEVRQKINDKLVAKIVINTIYGKRIHAILIINSSNIQVVPIKRTESHSQLSNNESRSLGSRYSWRKLKVNERDSAENTEGSSNDFPSSQTTENISEGECKIVKSSTLTSTVDSYGFKNEISASSNPASNPTPSVFCMLTEDQKLTKLNDVMDQINKEGEYLCRFKKELNSFGQFFYSYTIFNLEMMKNDPIHCQVIFCLDSSDPICCFNCKAINKVLFMQIVPLIHQNAKLLFFNINHITRSEIDILDSIFSEYYMSNYKTTLYKSFIFFFPEEAADQSTYKLSNQIFLTYFINSLFKNVLKRNTMIVIQNIMFTYDELITFLLSLQCLIVQFNNCLILINKCSTNKLNRRIKPKCRFQDCIFENKNSKDERNSFMYSISQNPYFFKSLINFEIEDADDIHNMFSSFITSNKSRSLIYRFMLSRLKDFASSKVLNYKYDKENSSLQIDICEKYYFWCIVNKGKNVDINYDFCKFILSKICSNLYDYLMLHRWYIPSELECRIKSMIKYMKKYEHSKNIKFKDVIFYHKLKSKSLVDILFNLLACSSFPEIYLQISYNDISNCIGTAFSKIMKLHSSSVQKVVIFNRSIFDYIDCENSTSKNQIKVMLAEYGVSYHTYVLYKFLENSRLLDSIKEIEFIDSLDIDYTTLESLIAKYQSKHNMQLGISFKLRAHLNSFTDTAVKVNQYFYSMISKYPTLSVVKFDHDELYCSLVDRNVDRKVHDAEFEDFNAELENK